MPWSCQIVSVVEHGGTMYYRLKVRSDSEEWSLEKRFSQFVQLDKDLSAVSADMSVSRAALPSRDHTGLRRRLTPSQFEDERKTGLDLYLQQLSSQIPSLKNHPVVCEFLAKPGSSATRNCMSFVGMFCERPVMQLGRLTQGDQPSSEIDYDEQASVGPGVVIVLKPSSSSTSNPQSRQNLVDLLESGLGYPKLKVTTVMFAADSPLHDYQVFNVEATFTTLTELAEIQRLPKLVNECTKSSKKPRKVWRVFSRESMNTFSGSKDLRTFFTPSEVLTLITTALNTAYFLKADRLPSVIEASIAGHVDSIFALHNPKDLQACCAKWTLSLLPNTFPVEDIAGYFGNASAMYFNFMRIYARWLVPPAVVCATLSALFHFKIGVDAKEEFFAKSRFSYVVTFLITLWSTLFCARIQQRFTIFLHRIGCDPMQRHVNKFDCSSAGFLKAWGCSSIFEKDEASAFVPYAIMVLVMCSMFSVTAVVIGVLLWVGEIAEHYTSNIILVNSPILLYIVVIGQFQKFYDWLAKKLTQFEHHQMYSEYLKSLRFKTAAFTLLNNLGWFLYIAFWMQDMSYLRSQLLMFFTVKQVIGNFLETGLPWLTDVCNQRKEKDKVRKKRSESEDRLNPSSTSCQKLSGSVRSLVAECRAADESDDCDADARLQSAIELQWQRAGEDLADDYSEIATLFAAAVWFSPVFPLGLPLALIHAIQETGSDRHKLCNALRRPLPDPNFAVGAEAWLTIFNAIGFVGVVVSVALIGVSHQGAWNPVHLVCGQNIILFVKLYLCLSIPAEPEWLSYHLSNVAEADASSSLPDYDVPMPDFKETDNT